MVNLLIEMDGDEQLNRTLTRFTDRINDARPAFDKIADRIAAGERRQFASQGGYGSGGWAPLAPRYRAWKMRHYPGKPILQRTGALMESLTRRPFGIERINPQSMTVGTGLPYSTFHQHGTSRMPRRRPLELPATERVTLAKVVQRFLVTGDL